MPPGRQMNGTASFHDYERGETVAGGASTSAAKLISRPSAVGSAEEREPLLSSRGTLGGGPSASNNSGLTSPTDKGIGGGGNMGGVHAHGAGSTSPRSRGPMQHHGGGGGGSGSGGNSSSGAGTSGSSSSSTFSSAVASEVMYCLVSAGTILFNKHALSTFAFPAPNTLLLFQFGLAVGLLKATQMLGLIQLEPLRWQTVKLWAPLNLIFVAMNVTGFFALQAIGAGMFTVLKNLSNLLTIGGDWYFNGLTYSWQVWMCLLLMILSAGMGGWTDLQFNLVGYAWQLVNCCFTAAYSLYLASVIKWASTQQHDKKQLSQMSMVYYNNVLSLPPLAVLVLLSGELSRLPSYPMLDNVEFQIVAVLGGLMGFMVSFASIWCMSRTSPTIYGLTGSLNKVVVALVGMWYFREPATGLNLVSIATGLLAGLMFVFAKSTPNHHTSFASLRKGGASGGAAAAAEHGAAGTGLERRGSGSGANGAVNGMGNGNGIGGLASPSGSLPNGWLSPAPAGRLQPSGALAAVSQMKGVLVDGGSDGGMPASASGRL